MLKPVSYFIICQLIVCTNQAQALSMKTENEFRSLYENRSCADLYYAVSELEYQALNYESALYNSRNNSMASVASTVFSPAVFFVGVSNAVRFKSELDTEHQIQELNFLRQRMAELNCFAK